MTTRKLMSVLLGVAGVVLTGGTPASAAHPHYVVTPNGDCHAVAGGQTSIDDREHGGYHRFHHNVHMDVGSGGTFGQSSVVVAKGVCPT